jgi:hypothetical protein
MGKDLMPASFYLFEHPVLWRPFTGVVARAQAHSLKPHGLLLQNLGSVRALGERKPRGLRMGVLGQHQGPESVSPQEKPWSLQQGHVHGRVE